MSIRIRHATICDLCGHKLHDTTGEYATGFGAVPTPISYGSSVNFWPSQKIDLCEACIEPLHKAFKARLTELESQGRLRDMTVDPFAT